MEMNNRRKGVGGILLMIALVFGISVASSMTAQAQWRTDDQYRRDRNWNDDQNREYRREQRERREQEERARQNNVYGYGTSGTYGNYGNYGYNNNAYRVEMNQGYQYGVNTGASDAQRGQSYSPQRWRYYRNTSSQAFRQGFVQGYDAGYRQYSGYGRTRSSSVLGRIL